MAVQYFVGSSGSGSHVFAGFESGHLVHWDARNPSVVVSSIKLYEEPGVYACVCVYVRDKGREERRRDFIYMIRLH